MRGHREVIDLLRSHGAAFDLATAARLGRVEDVRHLLEAGADPGATSDIEVNISGEGNVTRPQSALLGAAVHRRHEVCELLIEAGSEIDSFTAAALGRTDELLQAIRDGHALDAVDAFGRSVLHRAIQGHRLETVIALLELGADLDQPADGFSHGPRALHVAASSGASEEMLRVLVEAGAIVDQQTNLGTPLECALRSSREAAAEALRKLGAEV